MMFIRKGTSADLPRIMAIYARARRFMVETGNPHQWAERNWPPEDLIRHDLSLGRTHVCVSKDDVTGEETVVGTFYYFFGEGIDPTYFVIEEGNWSRNGAFGVVHRIATDGTRGVGTFCLNWAFAQCGYLRIDTHPDNRVMQNLLGKLGFRKCGIIHILEDGSARLAFDRVR